MLTSEYKLWLSSPAMNSSTRSASTSAGEPSGLSGTPRRVTMMAPDSPALAGAAGRRDSGSADPPPQHIPVHDSGTYPRPPHQVSRVSSVWLWYIHMTEDASLGPGPARSGTCHTYVCEPPGGTASSALSSPQVPSM